METYVRMHSRNISYNTTSLFCLNEHMCCLAMTWCFILHYINRHIHIYLLYSMKMYNCSFTILTSLWLCIYRCLALFFISMFTCSTSVSSRFTYCHGIHSDLRSVKAKSKVQLRIIPLRICY